MRVAVLEKSYKEEFCSKINREKITLTNKLLSFKYLLNIFSLKLNLLGANNLLGI